MGTVLLLFYSISTTIFLNWFSFSCYLFKSNVYRQWLLPVFIFCLC